MVCSKGRVSKLSVCKGQVVECQWGSRSKTTIEGRLRGQVEGDRQAHGEQGTPMGRKLAGEG